MKPIIIFLKKPWLGRFAGITIWPFIFFYKGNKSEAYIQKILNHESIHIRQQLEMLIIPFYIVYGISFLYNFFKHYLTSSYMDAYKRIPFEIEAYENEHDFEYLNNRKFWAWLNYFVPKHKKKGSK